MATIVKFTMIYSGLWDTCLSHKASFDQACSAEAGTGLRQAISSNCCHHRWPDTLATRGSLFGLERTGKQRNHLIPMSQVRSELEKSQGPQLNAKGDARTLTCVLRPSGYSGLRIQRPKLGLGKVDLSVRKPRNWFNKAGGGFVRQRGCWAVWAVGLLGCWHKSWVASQNVCSSIH